MSAVWGSPATQTESLPRQKRMLRMWACTVIGLLFYLVAR